MKKPIALAAVVTALVATPTAAAHVTANPSSAEAGGFGMVGFRVPHGCEESPTTSLTIRIPAGVVFVAPQAVPGWKVTTREGTLPEPVEAEGETITEGVTQVTWTGGPLSPHTSSRTSACACGSRRPRARRSGSRPSSAASRA
jgi:uncharacterized protein YcnI